MKAPALDARTKAINAAMRRASKVAAARARTAGTKLYVIRNGKLVAEKP
jgi:hypothetical protein